MIITFPGSPYKLNQTFQPAGDQPEAISKLVEGIESGLSFQTLLGVTGSGKTFTIANVIQNIQRPTLVIAHNKTLAAQLYGEFREFFPNNAVEYFVSYYDYYQPEAYVPASDTYIEKDSSVNEHIEQMRLSATKALLERRDAIIVATVSSIYGLGDPAAYLQMVLHLKRGDKLDQRALLRRLAEMQYTRNDMDFTQGCYRVRGDVIDIFPAESDRDAIRVELFDDVIEQLSRFDPLTGEVRGRIPRFTVYPGTHFVTPRDRLVNAIDEIREDLRLRLHDLHENNKLVEAQRLQQRTTFDLEMIQEIGYCQGIENYSRYLSGRQPGEPPPCLYDYLPPDALLVVDESHQTIPQLGAMYKGDRSRKETLVEFGFRLPSALDNRPLKFEEWESVAPQMIFVSATPGPYEGRKAGQVVEQLVRPTGLVDPPVEIRPVATQVDDVLSEINLCKARGERALVTTLTKRMAEDLTEYMQEAGVKMTHVPYKGSGPAAIAVIGNSIALYNPPIRVAEEFAMLDVISGGRLIAGFPVGTSMDTNYCYGQIPALTRDKYAEAHELIMRAWHEDQGRQRTKIIIPDSAHGTNPATVAAPPPAASATKDFGRTRKILRPELVALVFTSVVPPKIGSVPTRVSPSTSRATTLVMTGASSLADRRPATSRPS